MGDPHEGFGSQKGAFIPQLYNICVKFVVRKIEKKNKKNRCTIRVVSLREIGYSPLFKSDFNDRLVHKLFCANLCHSPLYGF